MTTGASWAQRASLGRVTAAAALLYFALALLSIGLSRVPGSIAALWLPDAAIAAAGTAYQRDTLVPDLTPPPAPTGLRVQGRELAWQAEADLESGLAGFVIERDGVEIARLPKVPKNPFGRPVFQNLQYSDTPGFPLVPLRFTDTTATPGQTHAYRVRAVNTVGLVSE